MKEQLISLETAKLAFEKGFDIECYHFFNEGSGFRSQCDSLIRTGEGIIYEQPTQAFLQKWLREKYNIHLWLVPIYSTTEFNVVEDFHQHVMSILVQVPYHEDFSFKFPTYEEALENLLLFALNLIK